MSAFLALLDENHSRPRRRFDFSSSSPEMAEIAGQAAAVSASALVLLAGVEDSAAMLQAIRAAGFSGAVYGGPSMGRQSFLDRCGDTANGILLPLPRTALLENSAFARRYHARYGAQPDYGAVYANDAVGLVVDAVRKAGLDRTAIRDALQQITPWQGASGTVRWDKIGRNRPLVALHEIVNGRPRPR